MNYKPKAVAIKRRTMTIVEISFM